ncbi:MAG: PQQ-dependent sugar dehydrogenase [Planctomycetota bacterium]
MHKRLTSTAFALCVLLGRPTAQNLPPGFQAVPLSGVYDTPVGLAISDRGLLFVLEQRGFVRIHDGEEQQTRPFINLEDEVHYNLERGLLGIALHPGFLPDGGRTSWVYLLYTVSPVPGQDLAYGLDEYPFSRLTRYRATFDGSDVVADLTSRQVLLGNQRPDGSVPDCIASLHLGHSNGSLHFADDGSLLVAAGDGANYNFADTGGKDAPGFDNWVHPLTGLRGPTPAEQDSGAFRSQDLRSLAGKVLRINPDTGEGYRSNPFYDGDLGSNPSRVWALGLRNPFRMLVFPGTGASDVALGQPNVLGIGDVGWETWEEFDICQGAENFGWPCYEALVPEPAYQAFQPSSAAFPTCATPLHGNLTDPIVAWHQFAATTYEPAGTYVDEQGNPLPGFSGRSAIGGTVYTTGNYPDYYHGRVFFGDYGTAFIKTLELDENYNPIAIRPFGTGFGQLSSIERHPISGDLYVTQVTGLLKVLRYEPVTTYGCGVNPAGSLAIQGGAPVVGGTANFELHNPLGTQSPGAATLLGVATKPDSAFPCGKVFPGLGMGGPLADGEVLLNLSPVVALFAFPGPPWQGSPVTVSLALPDDASLAGLKLYTQGAIVDPSFGGASGAGIGLTEALSVLVGL